MLLCEYRALRARQRRQRFFEILHSIFPFGRRGSYNLEERRQQEYVSIPSCSNYKTTFLPPKDDADEKFLMTLYKEGLLKTNFILKDGYKKHRKDEIVVFVKYEHPVIEICTGFTNRELVMTDRFEKYRCYMPNNELEIDGSCKVSIENKRDMCGRRIKPNNLTASRLIDIYDQEVEHYLLKKFNRYSRRRSILTLKGHHGLVRPPPTKPMLIGDNMLGENHFGPRFFLDHPTAAEHQIMIHVLTYRIGELGERHRLGRYIQGPNPVEYILPNTQNGVIEREMDRHFPRRPTISRSVHRSGSNPDQLVDNRDHIPTLYDFVESDVMYR